MAAGDNNLSNVPKPKSRRTLWVVLGLIGFILVLSYLNSDNLVEIHASRFTDMLTHGEIGTVVIVENEERVEITLTKEALGIPAYRQELEFNNPFGVNVIGPHYKMKISSVERFLDEFEEIATDTPQNRRAEVLFEDRADIIGLVMNWTFLLILLFGMIMLIIRIVRTDFTRLSFRKVSWILAALAAVIIASIYLTRSPRPLEIQSDRLFEMVAYRDISKLVLVKNLEQIEISLRPDALQNDKYNLELEQHDPALVHSKGPHYLLKIGTIDIFLDEYEKFAGNIPREQQVDIQLEERADITGMLLNWGFIFLVMIGIGMFVKALVPFIRR